MGSIFFEAQRKPRSHEKPFLFLGPEDIFLAGGGGGRLEPGWDQFRDGPFCRIHFPGVFLSERCGGNLHQLPCDDRRLFELAA